MKKTRTDFLATFPLGSSSGKLHSPAMEKELKKNMLKRNRHGTVREVQGEWREGGGGEGDKNRFSFTYLGFAQF